MEMDLTELFDILIKQYGDIDSSQEALRLKMEEDPELAENYKDWCENLGYSEKKGFAIYYKEYLDRTDSIWDSIYPNPEDGDDFRER